VSSKSDRAGRAGGGDRLRLFLALWPEDRLQQALHEATAAAVRDSGGLAVPARNLHVTLAFLGSTPAKLLPLVQAAAAAVSAASCEVRFDRIEAWPRQRLLCLVPSEPTPALADLAVAVGDALEARGFERERRAFRPHATLARRIRVRDPATTIDVPVWPVGGIALVASVTDPGGSIYRVIDRWRFD
jgi:RNA 2',3'-cyclic 3'-phosphodiesterase